MSKLHTKEKLEKEDILNRFNSGCKSDTDFNIGIEYERLPVSVVTAKAVPYEGDFGVCNFLRAFANPKTGIISRMTTIL